MSTQPPPSEYLFISRGQWDPALSPKRIQAAIDAFYLWLDRLVQEGKMKPGQRLSHQGKTVALNRPITDGPYGETKEAVDGY